MNNYKFIKDETNSDNKILAVDLTTSEILETETITLPVGSKIYTPAQQQAYKAYVEKECKKMLRRTDYQNQFILVGADRQYKDIKTENVCRLMFLSTYIHHNTNIIYTNNQTKATKKDLQKLLSLPTATFYRFWNDVVNKYLFENEDGTITIADCFLKGKISKSHKGKEWQKLYISAMRDLYRSTPQSRHLGYIFQLLPYINIEYNILCFNPTEGEFDLIEPMTLNDFCQEFGYSNSQRQRLLSAYSKIVLNVSGKKERLLSVVSNINKSDDNTLIYVNPNIIYKGHKWNDVKILGNFCRCD